jgi:hypothetical protein
VRVFAFGPADGRYTQTKKASVESDQVLLDGCQIEKITVNNFTPFRVRHSSRLSIDDQDLFYIGMVQALEQDTFHDHARCSRDDGFNFHDVGVCRDPPVLPTLTRATQLARPSAV